MKVALRDLFFHGRFANAFLNVRLEIFDQIAQFQSRSQLQPHVLDYVVAVEK